MENERKKDIKNRNDISPNDTAGVSHFSRFMRVITIVDLWVVFLGLWF